MHLIYNGPYVALHNYVCTLKNVTYSYYVAFKLCFAPVV